MQIGIKFSYAIHILLSIAFFKEQKVTGQFIASSIQTNLTIIRNIMGLLRNAGIITIPAGTGGATLTRPADQITLKDIFRAIDPMKDGILFKIHTHSAPKCPVGGNIVDLLNPYFSDAQNAMENDLAQYTLQDLLNDLNQKLQKENAGVSAATDSGVFRFSP
jgi:DNA-binding IscR family transcriptional regulator